MPGRSIGLLFQGWSRGNPASIPNYTICRLGSNPHSRGVYRAATAPALRTTGSSPLARGLPVLGRRGGSSAGIIPARAGFTRPGYVPQGQPSDHPRSRGVYGPPILPRGRRAGSSPLARGLLGALLRHRVDLRIIPARAGFTPCPTGPPSLTRDHPRSRGVYVHRPRGHLALGGSSPLARGLRLGVSLPSPTMRIIPARAGFTRRPPGRHRAGPDHPRSRGVYARRHAAGDERPGSSPLARGLLHHPHR